MRRLYPTCVERPARQAADTRPDLDDDPLGRDGAHGNVRVHWQSDPPDRRRQRHDAQLDVGARLWPRPVSGRARATRGQPEPDPQRRQRNLPLADAARAPAAPRDARYRADRTADPRRRQLALWYISAHRDESVFGADADRVPRRPAQCAPTFGVRPRHPPLRRRTARRSADRHIVRRNGGAADARERAGRAGADRKVFRAWLPHDPGRNQPLPTLFAAPGVPTSGR
jgi:hypothetical protein